MPRSHAAIKSEIWNVGSDFRQLDLESQWVYVMLLSQADINNLGVVAYAPTRWVRFAPNLGTETLIEALSALEQRRYTITDLETSELLIRTFIKHDKVWAQPKLVTNARKLIRTVESTPIRDYLTRAHPWLINASVAADEYEQTSHPTVQAPSPPVEAPSPPRRKGVSQGVSPPRARAHDDLPLPLDQNPPYFASDLATAQGPTEARPPARSDEALGEDLRRRGLHMLSEILPDALADAQARQEHPWLRMVQ